MRRSIKGKLSLSDGAFEHFTKQVFDCLLDAGCDRKEAVLFRLGLEECLSICKAHGLRDAEYRVYRRASKAVVRLKLPGDAFNPLYEMLGLDLDGSLRDYLTRIVTGFSYSYQGKANWLVCRLDTRRKSPAYVPTLVAIAAALVFSWALTWTPWAQTVLDEMIAPLSKSYIRLLNTFATPMIFFSVLCGLTNLADIGSVNLFGKRLLKQMCLWGIASAAMGVLISLTLQGNFSGLGGSDFSWMTTARDMLLEIIPESFVGAFSANNTQSVLLIAFLLAVVINRRRDSLAQLPALMNEINDLAADVLAIVCKLLPAYVFLSVSKLVLSSSIAVMLSVFRIIGLFLVVWAALLLAHGFTVWLRYGKRAGEILRGMLPGTLIALTTASGPSAMAQTMTDCRETLELPNELTQLGVPVYTVMNKPFSCANIAVMVLACAAIQGISFNLFQCVTLVLMAFVFSVASPPIPGGTMVCFAIAFSQFGIGEDMLALAVAAHTVNTFLTTGGNIFSVHVQLARLTDRPGQAPARPAPL